MSGNALFRNVRYLSLIHISCPLPTAVLSAQTGFPSYYYDDYTAHMEEIMDQWEKMDFRPDGIYTGFLAGDVQAEMALEFIERFADSDTRILTRCV